MRLVVTREIAADQEAGMPRTMRSEAWESHQRIQLTDGFGRARYTETFTGSAAPYTLYGMQTQTYDWLGDVVRVTGPNPPPGAAGLSTSAQTTATYDLLGRKTALTDADLGSYSFPQYDANGNLRESVDPRGASGTLWIGYDGLNRPVWRNTTNTPTGAYVSYTYDEMTQTSGHGSGIGRLTTESFNSGQSLGAGSYSYSYDARGQQTALTVTLDSTHTFGFAFGSNDAGQPTSVQYSDGETLTYGYSAFGWLSSATLPGTTLATTLGYSGVGGAAQKPTSASVGNNTYTFSASYDNDLRLASSSLAATSGGTTLYATSRAYDAVGNVASVSTTLAAGTDSQAFCYDEQNRLVWASSQSATGPCGQANTAGSLSAAAYTATYAYDALNRLSSATAQGSYTYGDAAHLHAATATSSGGYSATYDLAGDLICRAPNSAVTCVGGSPTGAVLAYDTERRLISWASAPSNPGATASYAYDGEGHRVAQRVTAGGSTTTTYYVAGLEEQANTGSTSTLTKYYSVPGILSAVNVGGTLSLLSGGARRALCLSQRLEDGAAVWYTSSRAR